MQTAPSGSGTATTETAFKQLKALSQADDAGMAGCKAVATVEPPCTQLTGLTAGGIQPATPHIREEFMKHGEARGVDHVDGGKLEDHCVEGGSNLVGGQVRLMP